MFEDLLNDLWILNASDDLDNCDNWGRSKIYNSMAFLNWRA